MSGLDAYRARRDSARPCDHTSLDCDCWECECRGVWSMRDPDTCTAECGWRRSLVRAFTGATELAPDRTGTCPRCHGEGDTWTIDGDLIPCTLCRPEGSSTSFARSDHQHGSPTIDGVEVEVGDRIKFFDGGPVADGGIYTVTAVGGEGEPFRMERPAPLFVDASGGPMKVSLPADPEEGARVMVKKTDASEHPVTVEGADVVLTDAYESVQLIHLGRGEWGVL